MESTPILTKDGKRVGTLKGSVLYKYVNKSKHLFKSIGDNGSWGIDYDVLFKKIPERGSVYIQDNDDHILYMVKVGQWKEYGHIKHFKSGTDDHYTQVFLPIEYFDKVRQK